MKNYMYLLVIMAVAAFGGAALHSYNTQLDKAYDAGETAAGKVCADEKVAAIAQAVDRQQQLHEADTRALHTHLAAVQARAGHFEKRYNASMRYANALHTTDTHCNYTVGAVRVLNDTVRDGFGLPAAAPLADADAAAASVVTGETLRAWAGQCANGYVELSQRYTLLLDRVAARGDTKT